MIKNAKNVTLIEVHDWDTLVSETYNRPYSFQQQNDCQDRGIFKITIPMPEDEVEEYEEQMNESIPEKVNGDIMGVRFKTWLERDPNTPFKSHKKRRDANTSLDLSLFWERNFYPNIYTVANDLYKKGLIEKGDYIIDIDW